MPFIYVCVYKDAFVLDISPLHFEPFSIHESSTPFSINVLNIFQIRNVLNIFAIINAA